jgi:hypothetical protein
VAPSQAPKTALSGADPDSTARTDAIGASVQQRDGDEVGSAQSATATGFLPLRPASGEQAGITPLAVGFASPCLCSRWRWSIPPPLSNHAVALLTNPIPAATTISMATPRSMCHGESAPAAAQPACRFVTECSQIGDAPVTATMRRADWNRQPPGSHLICLCPVGVCARL